MTKTKTQEQHFYTASRQVAKCNLQFMELITGENPITRKELETLIKKRPALWARYAGFAGSLK